MARSKSQRGAVASVVTFSFFMGEAIIHYNMGRKKSNPEHKFGLPTKSVLTKLALVVGIFSILNGVVIQEVKKVM